MKVYRCMSLGTFIASRRKYMKLTQEKLAEKLSVSKSAIAKWETDGGIPDRDNLKDWQMHLTFQLMSFIELLTEIFQMMIFG